MIIMEECRGVAIIYDDKESELYTNRSRRWRKKLSALSAAKLNGEREIKNKQRCSVGFSN